MSADSLQKRLDEEIERSAQLQKELLDVAALERSRLGHELHDGIGQQLTAAAFLCKALETSLKDVDDKAMSKVKEIKDIINSTLDRTRRLSQGLQPISESHSDMTVILKGLAARCESLSRIQAHCLNQEPFLIESPKVLTELYLITQEALQNVVKHSEASHVWISLTADNGMLELMVEDNGRGLSTTQPTLHGLGQRIMQTRARDLGGDLSLTPSEKGGVKLSCRIPYGGSEGNRYQFPF